MPWNKETAAEAGAKGKRGKDTITYEAKMELAKKGKAYIPKAFKAIDKLEDEPEKYLTYLIKLLALFIPKGLNIEGDIEVSGDDARARLIAKLAQKIEQSNTDTDNK